MPALLELSGWEWFEDDGNGIGIVKIFGVPHHLEAIRIDEKTSTFDKNKITLAEQICNGRPLQEVEIDGDKFVFLMVPFTT